MFAYCGNNPVCSTDIFGNFCVSAIFAVALIAICSTVLASCGQIRSVEDTPFDYDNNSFDDEIHCDTYAEALKEAYKNVYKNGSDTGIEYAANIYYDSRERTFMVGQLYNSGSQQYVRFINNYGTNKYGDRFYLISQIHYHPNTSISPSAEDFNVARQNKIIIHIVNCEGEHEDERYDKYYDYKSIPSKYGVGYNEIKW